MHVREQDRRRETHAGPAEKAAAEAMMQARRATRMAAMFRLFNASPFPEWKAEGQKCHKINGASWYKMFLNLLICVLARGSEVGSEGLGANALVSFYHKSVSFGSAPHLISKEDGNAA